MTAVKVSRSAVFLAASIAAIAIILLLLMLPGEKGGPQAITYNGFEFTNVDGLWRTAWERDGQPYELDFRFNPAEVADIPVEGKTDVRFQHQSVFITFDPSENKTSETSYVALAAVEISRKLVDPFERDVIAACTKNETQACASRPIITCDSTDSSVIYLKQHDEAKIILEGNCVTLQGRNNDLVRAADRALFEWLGIMRE